MVDQITHVCKHCVAIFDVDPQQQLKDISIGMQPGYGYVFRTVLRCPDCGEDEFVAFTNNKLKEERIKLEKLMLGFGENIDPKSKQFQDFLKVQRRYNKKFTTLNKRMSERFKQPLPMETDNEIKQTIIKKQIIRNFNDRQ